MVYIEPEDLLAVGQFLGELPGAATGFDTLLRRIESGWAHSLFAITSTRENSKDKDLGGGMPLLDQVHNRLGPGKDLLRSVNFLKVPVVAVVGPNQDHRHLG